MNHCKGSTHQSCATACQSFASPLPLGLALTLQHQFRDVALPVLSLAVAIATWYGGIGPSVLAVLLSTVWFNYFFVEPIHSFLFPLGIYPTF